MIVLKPVGFKPVVFKPVVLGSSSENKNNVKLHYDMLLHMYI